MPCAQPFQDLPRGGFQPGGRAVFGFEAVLHDFELQRADGGEQRHALPGDSRRWKTWITPSCRSWSRPLRNCLYLPGFGIVQIGEALRREARDFVVSDGRVLGERVADAEARSGRPGRRCRRRTPRPRSRVPGRRACANWRAAPFRRCAMDDDHVALELAGADAHEGDAVAVLRVHVRLDLEDEAGEGGIVRARSGDPPATMRRRAARSAPGRNRAAAARRNYSRRCRRRPGQLAGQHRRGRSIPCRPCSSISSSSTTRAISRRHPAFRARAGRRGR